MIIELTNVSARVSESTRAEREWLSGFLTYQEKDLVLVNEDGESTTHARDPVRLLNLELLTFPAGLVGRVVDAAPKATPPIRCEVDDLRKIPHGLALLSRARSRAAALVQDPNIATDPSTWGELETNHVASIAGEADPFIPFKHQARAAERCLERTRGIVEMPTGSGKGSLLVLLTQLYPVRWLALVPSRELLDQTAARFEQITGKRCGKIGDGTWELGETLTVATFQALDARLRVGDPEAGRWIHTVEALAVDEVHALTGSTFYWIAQQTSAAYLRIGFSATPLRGGFRDIYSLGATGDLIFKVTPAELHAIGLVAYPRVRAIKVLQGERVTRWQTAHTKLVVNSTVRNMAIAMRCKIAMQHGDLPGLILVDKTEHGEALQSVFTTLGMGIPLVHGKTKRSVSKAVLAGLHNGNTELAIATGVWRTGVDIPGLRMTCHASGGKASVPLIQGLGRGMRVVRDKEGKLIKDKFLALDVADAGCGFLARHWHQRKGEYQRAGYEVAIED